MNPEIIQNYKSFLAKQGYSTQTIHAYAKALEQAPDSWNTQIQVQLYEHIKQALNDKDKLFKPGARHNIKPASSLLFLMITGEPFKNFEHQRKLNNTKHADILKEFFKYSTEFKHISIMSANAEIHHVSVFLDSLSQFPDDWSMLTANDVSNYICTSFHGLKTSSIGRYITSLRNFFRFLEYKGYTINQSVLDLPLSPADWAKSKVPVILTSDEEDRLRSHYTLDNENGIRNNIIIRLMLDLGLRCAEIPDLLVDDIKWANALIQIRNTKNNQIRELPISNEIGSRLEDYILHHRPNIINEPHLFLRKYINQYTSMNRENVRGVIRRTFEKENINGWWKGTHALRRTAASRIYNSGSGLKLTADILGHESIDSTKAYIKVDFKQLVAVATPWPGGDCNG